MSIDPIKFAVDRLSRQAAAIEQMVIGLDREQAVWKPSPDDWSILEVVNHLLDEEREDFRVRLDLTLHSPEVDWPPIDPQGWVAGRRYSERDLVDSLLLFMEERRNSLTWLADLGQVDLGHTHVKPGFPPMRAGDLLFAWVAHDCLHLRQLNELRYHYLLQTVAPFDVAYAGDW